MVTFHLEVCFFRPGKWGLCYHLLRILAYWLKWGKPSMPCTNIKPNPSYLYTRTHIHRYCFDDTRSHYNSSPTKNIQLRKSDAAILQISHFWTSLAHWPWPEMFWQQDNILQSILALSQVFVLLCFVFCNCKQHSEVLQSKGLTSNLSLKTTSVWIRTFLPFFS